MTSEKTLEELVNSALISCNKREHYWSSWVRNYAVGGPRPPSWEEFFACYDSLGYRKPHTHEIYTRECLYCGSRQRKIIKLYGHVDLGHGMSRDKVASIVIIDLHGIRSSISKRID